MRRFWILLRFELVKVLARKKALLFLLALNVLPIMSGLMAMLVYIKYQGWGLGEVQFSFVVEGVKKLLAGHVKLFALISPFFLALVIGDSFSGESGKGLMKTLLLTPVPRWQVIIAKTMAVMLFLITALAVGGVFLQFSLFVARAVTSSPSAEGLSQMVGNSPAVAEAVNQALKDRSTSLQLVGAMPALRLLLITFLANLSVVGFFILFSL
ncbi:MAG TPA: ABC transporter permease, partial [Candidatus Ozemobacteraceae bacterium]|nr:ABC transporter permease [Candidatus Ozemobacteraceae bacterium]